MFKKVLAGITILLFIVIIIEVLYLFVFKTKTGDTATVVETKSTASPPSSFRETEQDTLKVNKILGIYLSSGGPMFVDGEIKTTLEGYVMTAPIVKSDSIVFEMNVDKIGHENVAITAFFENSTFLNQKREKIDYQSINPGDRLSVVYMYNYKIDQYFTEIIIQNE